MSNTTQHGKLLTVTVTVDDLKYSARILLAEDVGITELGYKLYKLLDDAKYNVRVQLEAEAK